VTKCHEQHTSDTHFDVLPLITAFFIILIFLFQNSIAQFRKRHISNEQLTHVVAAYSHSSVRLFFYVFEDQSENLHRKLF
jgi:hypothetical protein